MSGADTADNFEPILPATARRATGFENRQDCVRAVARRLVASSRGFRRGIIPKFVPADQSGHRPQHHLPRIVKTPSFFDSGDERGNASSPRKVSGVAGVSDRVAARSSPASHFLLRWSFAHASVASLWKPARITRLFASKLLTISGFDPILPIRTNQGDAPASRSLTPS